MSNRVVVDIRQEHIDAATKVRAATEGSSYNVCRDCVVAVAATEAFGRPTEAAMDRVFVQDADGQNETVWMCVEKWRMDDYVHAFDSRSLTVEPTTFTFERLGS